MKPNLWEIVRREDGTFDIIHKGELSRRAITDRWLEDELCQYGFCGEEYKDIRRKLDQSGRATIAL